MSNMLEQAIIDAAALRETAMKNAEATLIEKYNKEFQNTVKELLEQEEVEPPAEPAPEEMTPDTAAANAEDPTGPTITDAPTDVGLGSPTATTSKAFEKVKSAFFDVEGDDDEIITINFDGLKAKPVDANMGSPMATPSMPPTAPTTEPMLESLDLDEELEIELERYDAGHNWDSLIDESDELDEENCDDLDEEIELEESGQVVSPASPGLRQDAARDKQRAAEKETKAAILDAAAAEEQSEKQLSNSSDEIKLTEEELNEIEESLRVDMSNESEGYMGSHKKKKREFENVAYAAARDSDKEEELEEKRETLKDLQESIKNLTSQNLAYKSKNKEINKLNNDLLNAIQSLKEQIQKINISNAKLLYTNKVLSNVSLNERQKNNIVENITKAESVSEAKTIYETLQSTVQSVVNNSTPKSLSEALNRKQTPFVTRKQPASHSETFADRMKALAGIKKVE